MRSKIAIAVIPLGLATSLADATFTLAAETEKAPPPGALTKKAAACFCLRRKGTTGGADHLGCTRTPKEATQEITCITTGTEYTVKNFTQFDEIAAGGNGCNPCFPVIPIGTLNPRGDK